MPIANLYEFLIDHVNIDDHPQFAGWPPEKKAIHVSAEFFTMLNRNYDALASADTKDDAEVEAAIAKFMDRYVKPLTKTGRPVVDSFAAVLMSQVPSNLTRVLASSIQDRMGS